MGVELDEQLKVVSIHGVPDNMFSRLHGNTIVDWLIRDYNRGFADQDAKKARLEKKKVVRAELPELSKASVGV